MRLNVMIEAVDNGYVITMYPDSQTKAVDTKKLVAHDKTELLAVIANNLPEAK